MISFILNDENIRTDQPSGLVLLDFIRHHKNLKGTKVGCREGDCGACTVLVGELRGDRICYRSMTSCLVPLINVAGKHVVTIEGVNGSALNAVQLAMHEEGATQCGFCTPGFVMSLTGHCLQEGQENESGSAAGMDGNICRCTGYKSIERAALQISGVLAEKKSETIRFAISHKIVPEYFESIKDRLKAISDSSGFHLNSPGPDTNHFPEEALAVAGGTDLYVQRHDLAHRRADFLFNAGHLREIKVVSNQCTAGGSVTVTDLMESDAFISHFPDFHKYVRLISSTPIRNMATIAGNIVNASPIGDLSIFFLTLNAEVILSHRLNRRTIPLKDFFLDYKKLAKTPEEIVEAISFDLPLPSTRFNFEKVSKRTHLDIASVNSAMRIETEGNRILNCAISAGGVAPVPLYLSRASDYLNGKEITAKLIPEVVTIALSEVSPISDVRGSSQYKQLLLAQLIKSHFIEMFPEKISAAEIMHL